MTISSKVVAVSSGVALLALTAAPATAAPAAAPAAGQAAVGAAQGGWRTNWTWSSPAPGSTRTIDMRGITVPVGTHLWISHTQPRIRSVWATVVPPTGAAWSLKLALKHGDDPAKGTWLGQISLPVEAHDGRYRVNFTAYSDRNQQSHHDNASGFTLDHTTQQRFALGATAATEPGVTGLPVTAFWPSHVEGAAVKVTDPSGRTNTYYLSLVAGDLNYGRWQGSIPLTRKAPPGTWQVTTSYTTKSSSGRWQDDPQRSGRFTVRQTPALGLKISPTKVGHMKTVTISGWLSGYRSDGTWGPLPGRTIVPWWRYVATGSKWQAEPVHAKTDRNGHYSLTLQIGYYSLYFETRFAGDAGDTLFAPVWSNEVKVTVH